MSTLDAINAFMAIIGLIAVPIVLGILWKRGNDYRDLYIQAKTDYLREKNERLSRCDPGAKGES